MPFYPTLEAMTLDELVARFQSPSPHLLEEPGWFLAEAELAIRQQGEAGDAWLHAEIDRADEN